MDFTYKQPLEKILKDLKETQQVEKIKSASKSLSDSRDPIRDADQTGAAKSISLSETV